MNIKLHEITIRELTNGYQDNAENGVVAYGGKLDVRPPYQREFVYKDKQRDAVITTVNKNFPLNVMYWADKGDGTYEVIDGQQRTLSICQYVNGDFSYDMAYFHSLPSDKKEAFLDYKLMVYICSGTDSEKLGWFKTINIAGEKLTEQELRNAVYCGSWVTDAKRYFSKNGCAAYRIAKNYLNGTCIRQDYLETAIKWINKGRIEEYMSKHQHDPNANELWMHFNNVINWVQLTFTKWRNEMKSVDWGTLYDEFHTTMFDTIALEAEISKLMQDSDVGNKKGIYSYVLDRKEKHLNIRGFDENTRREIYEKQEGICPHCHKHFDIEFMEADHITPWSKGGRTIAENCQMLCQECNRRKSAK
jgi:hypothetical protein